VPARIRRNLTYANVMATIAVFLALGGTAMASFIVKSNADIGPGTVSGGKPPAGDHANIIAASIAGGDLSASAVGTAKLANNAVTSAKIANGSLLGADLAADTLTGSQIAESTLGTVPNASNAADSSALGGLPPSSFQQRVSGTCPAGGGVGSVGSDGSVTCNHNSVLPGFTNLTLGGITVGAHSCAKTDNVGWGQLAVGDWAIIVPDAATWPTGLIYQTLRSDKAGTIALETCNPTNATVSSPNVTVSIWAVKLNP
jgi:hypothetical protein